MKLRMIAPFLALAVAGCENVTEDISQAEAQAREAISVAKSVTDIVAGYGATEHGLPDFVKRPEGMTVQNKISLPTTEMLGGTITYTGSQDATEVVQFYRDYFAKDGFRIAMDMATAQTTMLTGVKDATEQSLTVKVSSDDAGTTNLTLLYAQPANGQAEP